MPDTTKIDSELNPEDRISYMGWRIVFVMFLATAAVLGSTIYGFIILTQPLAALHGWSPTQSGSLVSAMWLMAPLALVCAPIIDRIGPWQLLLIGLVLIATAFAAIPIISEFWQLYFLRIVTGAGKVFAIVSIPVIVSEWFSRRFAFAIAIAWCGGAFGGLVFAPTTEMLNLGLGWKTAAVALAALVLAVAAITALVGRRTAPETNASSKPVGGDASLTARPRNSMLAQDIRSINVFTAASMVFAVATAGVGAISFLIHASTLLEGYGFSATTAATLLGLAAAGAMAGSLIAGWTLDRMRAVWTCVGAGMFIAIGLGALSELEGFANLWLAIAAVLLTGAGIGACEILWITLTKRQFGTEMFAVTYGGWSFCYQAGYALGGIVSGTILAATSRTGFVIAIAMLFVPAIALSLWRPGMQNEDETADSHAAKSAN